VSSNKSAHTVSMPTAAHVDPIIVSGGSVNVKLPKIFQKANPGSKEKHFAHKNKGAKALYITITDKDNGDVLSYTIPNDRFEVKIYVSE
jgi:hypothetical protein